HHRLGGAVGLGDGVEIARALVVDQKRGPEERQDGFAGGGGKAADEGCKIDDRHGSSLRAGAGELLATCLAQSDMLRTVMSWFASGILNSNQASGLVNFCLRRRSRV